MSDVTTLSRILNPCLLSRQLSNFQYKHFLFCKHTLRPILPVYLTFPHRLMTRYISYTKTSYFRRVISYTGGGAARLRTQSDTKRVSSPEDCHRDLDARNNRFLTATVSSYLRFALRRRESLSKRKLEVMLPLVYKQYRIRRSLSDKLFHESLNQLLSSNFRKREIKYLFIFFHKSQSH